jgi:hypothetical protein
VRFRLIPEESTVDGHQTSGKGTIRIRHIGKALYLLLGCDDGPRRNVFPWGNFHILNKGVHHNNAAISDSGIKHRRPETNEAVIANVGGPMDESHVRDTTAIANPDRIIMAIGPSYPALFQTMDDNPILNVGCYPNMERCALIGPDGSTRGNEHVFTHCDITNQVRERMHIGTFMNVWFC